MTDAGAGSEDKGRPGAEKARCLSNKIRRINQHQAEMFNLPMTSSQARESRQNSDFY